MIENYLLEELVTFANAKTLAKTAATLNVTQPTVTRGMQKLEAELNVQLFDRQPNRITLTPTGQLAAKAAQDLLQRQRAFVTTVQNFDRSRTTWQIETTLPGPLVLLHHEQAALPSNVTVNPDFIQDARVVAHLEKHQATLVFSNQEWQTSTVESRFIGMEDLLVHLQKFMYQANQPSTTFAELAGLSFIVLTAIGNWRTIIQQNIPEAKFLYQPERTAFNEITKYSDFPYFSTNLSPLAPHDQDSSDHDDNRVSLPITDAAAHMPIYVSYLKTQRHQLQALIDQLTAAWPQN